jgi:hypothetical protein
MMANDDNPVTRTIRQEIAKLKLEQVQIEKKILDYEKALAVLEGGVVRQNRVIVLIKKFLATKPKATLDEITEYVRSQPGLVGKTSLETSVKQSLSRSINAGTIRESAGVYSLIAR